MLFGHHSIDGFQAVSGTVVVNINVTVSRVFLLHVFFHESSCPQVPENNVG
jgi:hypothetical protein